MKPDLRSSILVLPGEESTSMAVIHYSQDEFNLAAAAIHEGGVDSSSNNRIDSSPSSSSLSWMFRDRTWFVLAIVFLLVLLVLVVLRISSSRRRKAQRKIVLDPCKLRKEEETTQAQRWNVVRRQQSRTTTKTHPAAAASAGVVALSNQDLFHYFQDNTRIFTRSDQQQQQSLNSVRRAVSNRTTMQQQLQQHRGDTNDIEEGIPLDDLPCSSTVPYEHTGDDDDGSVGLAEQKSLVMGASCVCCAICFDSYKVGEQVTWIEPCCHQFHTDCLIHYITKTKWNQGTSTVTTTTPFISCPLCQVPFLRRDEIITRQPKPCSEW